MNEYKNRAPVSCGLNADWCCDAWHFGPSATPNTTGGDVYVLDNEDTTFCVVRRHYNDDNDAITQIGKDYATVAQANQAAQTLVDTLNQ